MNKNYQTIDDYISTQDVEHQSKLQELREMILEVAPKSTTETISYNMPTFRYNENLIHFAQFKNHIGIYPGPDAIVKYASELSSYKTSKGAIQIPNGLKIDKELIQKIIQYNVSSK